jgi:hypothetical protein
MRTLLYALQDEEAGSGASEEEGDEFDDEEVGSTQYSSA